MAEMTRRAKCSRQQVWARGDMKVGTAILRSGDPAFDLGANVTDVLAATGVDVLADQPDSVTFAKVTKRFGASLNVTLVNVAVGVGSGTVRLMHGENVEKNPRLASTKSTILAGAARVVQANSV